MRYEAMGKTTPATRHQEKNRKENRKKCLKK
jgi:hypothetical protein